MTLDIRKTTQAIKSLKVRGAWNNAVKTYALELLESREEKENEEVPQCSFPAKESEFLNGAQNWKDFSFGGCSLIYNIDLAYRLCTPSEFKRKEEGRLPPNSQEQWLDAQARALF